MRIKNIAHMPAVLGIASLILPVLAFAQGSRVFNAPAANVSRAVAVDVSPAVRSIAPAPRLFGVFSPFDIEIRPESGAVAKDGGFSGDAAVQESTLGRRSAATSATIASPLLTFEGISNEDNRTLYGGRVNPPDPVGDVGPNHYVEMANLAFAVYNKQGVRLSGPTKLGDLWTGFAINDCTDGSGDPVVVYDQLVDRWILTQFTTRGLNPNGSFNGKPFYNCVAISQTGDPTGAYFRYAFITSGPGTVTFFPDYPKYGVWGKSYLLTSRDFGSGGQYGISVYALEKKLMIKGDPNARMAHFFLDSDVVPLELMGDGLLPADLDGENSDDEVPAPIVGTMDNDSNYGATFDALNIWNLSVSWKKATSASLNLAAQLPVAPFDSIFPCGVTPGPPPPAAQPNSRDCLPQPGVTDGSRFLDILSYRQRPTYRLAYRNFGNYEAMVTNQSVEARPGVAGVRWYEVRRRNGQYSIFQQGTYAPDDGVHRWMGSIAMNRKGNIGLGYSVVNGTDVFPGIRYTGRLRSDTPGQMTLGEGVLMVGSGSQLTTNSRWGDYTSMNIDPTDDCTFWYVNEYYAITELAAWQTRIGSFRLPGCN